MSKKFRIGSKVEIPAGTVVTCNGEKTKRQNSSIVTIRSCQETKGGKFKISWKSNGYKAEAVLSPR